MTYIDPDLIGDEGVVAESLLAAVADQIPDWEPSEGHVEVAELEAWAMAVATAITVLKSEAAEAYAGMAELVLGIERDRATPSTALSTWTRSGPTTAAVLIPAGTGVTAQAADGTEIVMAVEQDYTMPVGSAALVNVVLIATDVGEATNGATGTATQYEVADVDDVVTLTTASTGGQDDEETDAYTTRARAAAQRLRKLPITPDDHADIALDVVGVERAYVLNRYEPGVGASNGHVTVWGLAATGDVLPLTVKAALLGAFTGVDRPLQIVYHIEDPEFVDVTAVAVTITVADDADDADVTAAVKAAVVTYLDPVRWYRDDDMPGTFPRALPVSVTAAMLAQHLADVAGIGDVRSVTVNGGATLSLAGSVAGVLVLPRVPTGTAAVAVTVTSY